MTLFLYRFTTNPVRLHLFDEFVQVITHEPKFLIRTFLCRMHGQLEIEPLGRRLTFEQILNARKRNWSTRRQR